MLERVPLLLTKSFLNNTPPKMTAQIIKAVQTPKGQLFLKRTKKANYLRAKNYTT
jgi:hypothetical protein